MGRYGEGKGREGAMAEMWMGGRTWSSGGNSALMWCGTSSSGKSRSSSLSGVKGIACYSGGGTGVVEVTWYTIGHRANAQRAKRGIWATVGTVTRALQTAMIDVKSIDCDQVGCRYFAVPQTIYTHKARPAYLFKRCT